MKTNIDLNNKTILVTGAPGFIGTALVLWMIREIPPFFAEWYKEYYF